MTASAQGQQSRRMVVALGGNALGTTPEEQLELVKVASSAIVDLVEAGYDVVVTHGNGPQVGMIKVATDTAATAGAGTPLVPFAECGAMSEGYIGYHLEQCIGRELAARDIDRQTVALVTQTEVDASDPAFDAPTKPVGAFFTEEQARRLMAETGNTYVEDAGRGWRWVVASPKPKAIVESKIVSNLLDDGNVVIAAGGGGIPVVRVGSGGYSGVPAVIDKDRTAALMATELGADKLVILTAVDQVALDYNKPTQRWVSHMTVAQARDYIADNQFAKGSMLPKIEACLEFVTAHPESQALITSLQAAQEALAGATGTIITASETGSV